MSKYFSIITINFFNKNYFQHYSTKQILILLVAILTACSPTYNWRIQQDHVGNFEALFPAPIKFLEKSINIANTRLPMRLYFSRVNDLTFAIGTVMIPDVDKNIQSAALTELKNNFGRQVDCDSGFSSSGSDNSSNEAASNLTSAKLTAGMPDAVQYNPIKKAGAASNSSCISRHNYLQKSTSLRDNFEDSELYLSKSETQDTNAGSYWQVWFLTRSNHIYQLTVLSNKKAAYSAGERDELLKITQKFFESFKLLS